MAVSTTPAVAATRPQRRTRRPLLLVGIGMAVVAFLLVLALGAMLSPSGGRARVPDVTVVVAAGAIPAGTVLTGADLTTAQVAKTALPADATAHTASLVGQMTQVAIPKAQPVTTNLVAAPGYVSIPSGWVGETIPADELEAVAGYAKKGDAIDIIATITPSSSSAQTPNSPSSSSAQTRTVFTDVRVVEVDARGATAQGAPTSLTVLLTPCDAVYLSWLINDKASFNYTLVSGTDYGAPPTGPSSSCPIGTNPAPVGQSQVFSRYGFQG